MRASGSTLWGWRFSSVAPALLAVIPTYLLARDLFDRRVAFVSGGLLITSPYFLAFARLGYNNSQALFPVAMAVWLAAAGVRRGSCLLMALSGVAAGMGFYTYGGGRLAAMAVPVYLLGLAAARRRSPARRELSRLFRAFVAGGFGMAAPLVVYGLSVHPVDFRSKTLEAVFPNLVYARSLYSDAELFRDHGPIAIDQAQFFFRPDLYLAMIGRGFFESAMAFVDKSFISEHFIAASLSGPIGAVLLAVGVGAALSRTLRARAAIVVWWLAVGFVVLAALDSFPPRQAHLVPVIPAIAILSGLGLVALADQAARLVAWRRAWVALVLAAAGMAIVGALGVRNYFVVMPERYRPDLENVAIFTALAAPGPETLLWVDDSPDRADYIPWGIEHLPSKAIFKKVSPADLIISVNALAPGTSCTVFWTPATNDAVVPALEHAAGAPVSPVVHQLFGGEVSGYSFTFTTPTRP
jgi:4-amino-4-deoxy-L-arabinose transferase-like glycosyltransferase